MKTLTDIFPHASQSVQAANPHLSSLVAAKLKPVAATARRRGNMNRCEREFSLILEEQKQRGEIRDYLFHPLSLPWAGMKYSPDFMVTPNSGLEKRRMIEVKGPHIHYRQQAIARFKGARAHWPEFAFECHQKTKSGWKRIM